MKRNENAWYAIRVTYSRELKLKDYLEEKSIKNFMPMHYEVKITRGKKTRKLVPVVHNLIFIYSTREQLDVIKPEAEYFAGMRYIMNKSDNSPITIPEKEMQNFIRVSGTMDEQLCYITEKIKLDKNDKVLITGGLFSGVTGYVIGTKKNCRVVVSIPGFMAITTAHIDPSMLEKISNQE